MIMTTITITITITIMITIMITITITITITIMIMICTPLSASWTKYGTLQHNYSLLYKALISTASLVLRRLFGVPNSMLSFPMATMVGLPFIIMHDRLIIVGHAQIINSPLRIFVKLVFIL